MLAYARSVQNYFTLLHVDAKRSPLSVHSIKGGKTVRLRWVKPFTLQVEMRAILLTFFSLKLFRSGR